MGAENSELKVPPGMKLMTIEKLANFRQMLGGICQDWDGIGGENGESVGERRAEGFWSTDDLIGSPLQFLDLLSQQLNGTVS